MPIAIEKICHQRLSNEHCISISADLQNISYQQWLCDVGALSASLVHHNAQRWALFHESAYAFSVGFFALLHAQKKIVLPGNTANQTLSSLKTICDGFLGEFPEQHLDIPIFTSLSNIRELDTFSDTPDALTIFTSGSSGEAKSIAKSLSQLNAEINTLEQCFGKELKNADIISTVSHQHIYGLLFSVLWPLCTGRAFFNHRPLDTSLVFSYISRHCKPLAWIASPAHLKRLPPELDWHAAHKNLALIFSSGGPLPESAAKELHELYHNSAIEVYGSSETGGIAWRKQTIEANYWTALPQVDIQCDADHRLLIRSPHLAQQDWYACDDSISLIANNQFYLKGRLDRIIKLEEKRLSLIEMENYLLQHPFVVECHCRVIQTQEKCRDDLVAVIALNQKGFSELNELGKFALTRQFKKHLANAFELSLLPKKWRFVTQLPTNSQSKIDKQAIEGLFLSHD